jgi:hypothetical protein
MLFLLPIIRKIGLYHFGRLLAPSGFDPRAVADCLRKLVAATGVRSLALLLTSC